MMSIFFGQQVKGIAIGNQLGPGIRFAVTDTFVTHDITNALVVTKPIVVTDATEAFKHTDAINVNNTFDVIVAINTTEIFCDTRNVTVATKATVVTNATDKSHYTNAINANNTVDVIVAIDTTYIAFVTYTVVTSDATIATDTTSTVWIDTTATSNVFVNCWFIAFLPLLLYWIGISSVNGLHFVVVGYAFLPVFDRLGDR